MWCVSFRPTCVHVSPPSSDLYTPSPHDELWRLFASPDPIQMTLGSEGAMAMSPIDSADASRSKVVVQVTPLFTVLNTPPDAVPTKMVDGLPGTASISSMRPPNEAGPMWRQTMWSSASASNWPPA